MQSRSLANTCGFVRSPLILKHGGRKWCQKECASSLTLLSSCESFFFLVHTRLPQARVNVPADGVCKAPSNQAPIHTHFFIFE